MKHLILKLILLLIITCNSVIGQDIVRKVTPNIDSIYLIKNMRENFLKDSTKIKPVKTTSFNDGIGFNLSPEQKAMKYTPPKGLMTPIWVLKNNNRIIDTALLYYLNPKSIKSINVRKDAATLKEYGSKAAGGVIEFTLIEDSIFLSVEKLLREYKLPKSLGKFPLYINEKPFSTEQIMLQKSDIKSVGLIAVMKENKIEKHLEVTITQSQPVPCKKCPESNDPNNPHILIR